MTKETRTVPGQSGVYKKTLLWQKNSKKWQMDHREVRHPSKERFSERSKRKENQVADNVHGCATSETGATSQTLLLYSSCKRGHDAINTCTLVRYLERLAL